MSGGHFDYSQNRLIEPIEELKRIVAENDNKAPNEYGEPIGYGYSMDVIDALQATIVVLETAYILLKQADWLDSGDNSEESYLAQITEELQKLAKDSL